MTQTKYRVPLPAYNRWTVEPDLALELIRTLRRLRPNRVIEFGSGLSTVLIGYELERWGGTVLSLEDVQRHAIETRDMCMAQGLQNVTIIKSPLEEYDLMFNHEVMKFKWYKMNPAFKLFKKADFMFIDGPSCMTGRYARFPAIPLLWDHVGRPTIMIDDTKREEDALTVAEWMVQYDLDVTPIDTVRGAALLTEADHGSSHAQETETKIEQERLQEVSEGA